MSTKDSKLKSWIIKHDLLIVWILIGVYIAYFSLYTCARHINFKTYAFDLGIFAQSTWHAVHYGTLVNSLEISQHSINHLAIHFSPILYLAVPFYFLFPDPKTLLVLQSVALGITAWPCYLLAKDKINNIFICLIIVISFLLYPPLHDINLYDVHPVALAVPILFFCLYFLEKQKYGWFWLFFILSLLIKENVILTGIGIGAYIFIAKRKFLFGIIIATISTAFFLVTTKIFMPPLGQIFNYTNRYADLIKSGHHSYMELVRTTITKPIFIFKYIFFDTKRLLVIFKLFFPTLFFSLFSGIGAIFLLVPGLLINLLSSYDKQYNFYCQYSSTIVPLIYFSAILGISNILQKLHYRKTIQKLIIICLFISVTITLIFQNNIIKFFKTFTAYTPSAMINIHHKSHINDLFKAIKLIPPKASVSAIEHVVPHIINRKKIFIFPTVNNAEYIIADLSSNYAITPQKTLSITVALLQSKKYGVIFFKDGILVLKRNYNINQSKIMINKIYQYNLSHLQKPLYNYIIISFDKFLFLPKFLRKILQHKYKYFYIKWRSHQLT